MIFNAQPTIETKELTTEDRLIVDRTSAGDTKKILQDADSLTASKI